MDLGFEGKALVGTATTFTDIRPSEDFHAAVRGGATSSGRGRLEFYEGTVGPLRGAEKVKFTLTDGGLVETIFLEYPQTIDVDSIRGRIQSTMDASGKGSPKAHSSMVLWTDWLTSISIHTGGERHYVLLSDQRLG